MIVFRGFRQYDLIDTKRRVMLAITKIIIYFNIFICIQRSSAQRTSG